MNVSLRTHVSSLDAAFKAALKVVENNIRPTQSGLLKSPEPILYAGEGYEGAWTRDAAINVWNVGYLFPEVAKNTLLSTLEMQNSKIQIAGEYWDSLLFFLGAWTYYQITSDKSFLEVAYSISMQTLRDRELNEFDFKLGLFRGPGVYNDGVSGYPNTYCGIGSNSAISEWAKQNPLRCNTKGFGLPMHVLSTNCLFYQVYRLLDCAGKVLRVNHPLQAKKAAALRASINHHFWESRRGRYVHLVDDFGGDNRQESLGLAFSIIFNVAPDDLLDILIQNTFVSSEGIPCIWPTYQRYRTGKVDYGRHSGTVWPFIQAFWAEALANLNQNELFGTELLSVANRAARDDTFYECYHPVTGLPYGGLQEQSGELVNATQLRLKPFDVPENGQAGIVEWRSMPGQLWSATGYLRMVINNLVGLKFTDKAIGFRPTLPSFIDGLELSGLKVGEEIFDVQIKGNGRHIKSLKVDGVESGSNWFMRSHKDQRTVVIECSESRTSALPLCGVEIQ